jgi:hypothetical protein
MWRPVMRLFVGLTPDFQVLGSFTGGPPHEGMQH